VSKFVNPNFPAIFTGREPALRQFDQDLINALGDLSFSLGSILDGGISLQDNMDAAVVSFTSNATPDTEDAIPHGLGKVPEHLIVSSLDKGAVVYQSGTAWTKTTIYVKTTKASTAVKLILL